ncbi:hypothetical protein FRB96_007488 [Tulasnella sp. 330]|nr:hypothetical protein FRB96_007488 [Tulasnella sp. 330]KAG8881553.1 hypothetical protein FRB97_009387 [Tulasnella sp. 331]KAG8887542.1 hypothetical protein FRB98_009448 [Tulasnella sp. 332]
MHLLDSEFPPLKRRRTTLADNLLTSALNIALVSTAFGMTAYRMWSSRREPEIDRVDKPPPYEEGNWQQSHQSPSPNASVDSGKDGFAKPKRRRGPKSQARTLGASRRKPAFVAPAPRPSPHGAHHKSIIEPEAMYDLGVPRSEVDEQMDSMSQQLQNLINEGRKALGREIVVDMDVQNTEDEMVDDGDLGWNDEGESLYGHLSSSRAGRRQSGTATPSNRRSRHSSPARKHNRRSSLASTIPYSNHLRQGDADLSRCHTGRSIASDEELGARGSEPCEPSVSSEKPGVVQDLTAAMDRVRRAYGLGV